MKYKTVGRCPKCGSSIYFPDEYEDVTPASTIKSCDCFNDQPVFRSSSTNVNEKERTTMGVIIDDIDLKNRPLYILTEGKLVSYNHDKESNPAITEIVYRYENKEYRFTISHIKVNQVENKQ